MPKKKGKRLALCLYISVTYACMLYAHVTHTVLICYAYFTRNLFFSFFLMLISTNQLYSHVSLYSCFFCFTHSSPQQKSSFFFALCLRRSPTNQLALSSSFTHTLRMLYSYFFFLLSVCDKVQQISWLSLLHSLIRCTCFTHNFFLTH